MSDIEKVKKLREATGGLTGNKYENTRNNNTTIIRSRRSSWT